MKESNVTDSNTQVVLTEEQPFEIGKKALHGNAPDRVLRISEATWQCGEPRVSLKQTVLCTGSVNINEGQNMTDKRGAY